MTDKPPETIHTEIVDGVGWLRYARPPMNAFDWTMLEATRAAFARLAADNDARVIVIGTAVETHLSAGADLKTFREATPEDMRAWVEICHGFAREIRECAKPVLAAIRGVAVGGGLEICLHADLRFCDPGARLGQPEINIAFIPPVAGTQALVRLVGRSAAFRILYSGEIMSAEAARAIGLVDTISALGAVEEETQTFAAALAQKPGNALAAIRRSLIDGGGRDFEAGMAIEAAEAAELAAHPNFREGVDAFLAKRAATWTRD